MVISFVSKEMPMVKSSTLGLSKKKCLTIAKRYDIIKVQKGKEIKTMKFYEIRNTKTQENGRGIAKNFAEICKSKGWRPQDCRLIWKADVSAAW
jgi:hypothetical protein